MGVMEINPWMVISFSLAVYGVVANDSLQTLGTFINSNASRTPRALQMVFLATITISVLTVGWRVNSGDPAWGRLEQIPLPEPFTWVYVLPPLAVLALTTWGAPVSTSFLVLCSSAPESLSPLLGSSLSGYGIALVVGLTTWSSGLWLSDRWGLDQSKDNQPVHPLWQSLQWLSTGALWSTWMVQDMANIFIYLPRQLSALNLALSTLLICLGLCFLVARNGGPMQKVLRSKANTTDLRTATLIDGLFALCLLARACLSTTPLSTTWVFLGLLAGREMALAARARGLSGLFEGKSAHDLQLSLGSDLWKACVGLGVSLALAFSLQPLAQWAAG